MWVLCWFWGLSANCTKVQVFGELHQSFQYSSIRNDQQERVIGTFCGSISSDGTVEIRNSYAVPHSEMADQVSLLSYCDDCLVDPHYAGTLLVNDLVEWNHLRDF